MSLEGRDGQISSRTRRLSSSSIISEEDKGNTGFVENVGTEYLRLPGTAARRKTETRCLKTNQTTGLKVAEQCAKNLPTNIRQLVTQKECMKLGTVRPITCRGQIDRNFYGIRHFQGVLHVKIRDIALEVEKLHWKYSDAQQEYINSMTYETKAKELASEITNFQKTLTDLNVAFDYSNRVGDIKELEQEVQQLEELNAAERERVEGIFHERKLREDIVNKIKNNEGEKKMINSSYPEGKVHYDLHNRLAQSSAAVDFWEKKIEQYKKVKDMLTQKLKKQSPFMDIILLEKIILGLKRKWNEVNENSTMTLNEEREIILETAKQDKSEIKGMESDMKILTKQINNLEKILDHLRSSEDDITETINIYLSSFDNKKDYELEKINLLKSDITNHLSDLTFKLSSIPTMTNYLNLNENKIGEAENSDATDLQTEYHSVFVSLKKLELMKFYQTKDCISIDEKCTRLKDDLIEYKSQTKIISKYRNQETDLTNQILKLEEDKKEHLKKIELDKAQLAKLEKEISENEKHKELLALDEKQNNLEADMLIMNQTINEMKTTTTHLLEIRAKTLNLMELINSGLINLYE